MEPEHADVPQPKNANQQGLKGVKPIDQLWQDVKEAEEEHAQYRLDLDAQNPALVQSSNEA